MRDIGKEQHGSACGALFYLDDAPKRLAMLAEEAPASAQLVYLDPPFMTGNRFEARAQDGRRFAAYRDDMGETAYWEMMEAALRSSHALLKPEGSLYLHCDYRTVARFRLLLDAIFGAQHFMNEIIWHYQSGGRAKAHFSRKHDNILFYRKSRHVYFDPEAVAARRGAARRNHMKRSVDSDGKVRYSIRSGGKIYTYDEEAPIYPSDVWSDISHLQQRDPERCGYATQKPLALMERIVRASSAAGDLVVDPFAGSGSMGVAALRNGRRFWGIDASPQAMRAVRRRFARETDGGFSLCYADLESPPPPTWICAGGAIVVETPPGHTWDFLSAGSYEDGSFVVESSAFAPFEASVALEARQSNALLAVDQEGRAAVTPLANATSRKS